MLELLALLFSNASDPVRVVRILLKVCACFCSCRPRAGELLLVLTLVAAAAFELALFTELGELNPPYSTVSAEDADEDDEDDEEDEDDSAEEAVTRSCLEALRMPMGSGILPCKAERRRLGVEVVVVLIVVLVVSPMTFTIWAVMREGERSRLSDDAFVVAGWLISFPKGETPLRGPTEEEGDMAGDAVGGELTRLRGLSAATKGLPRGEDMLN